MNLRRLEDELDSQDSRGATILEIVVILLAVMEIAAISWVAMWLWSL